MFNIIPRSIDLELSTDGYPHFELTLEVISDMFSNMWGGSHYGGCTSNVLYSDDSKMDCQIEKVIFNDPATIVFWDDGTKTVVKASGESFDKEKGLAMAISRKAMGNNGSYFDVFKKWCGDE